MSSCDLYRRIQNLKICLIPVSKIRIKGNDREMIDNSAMKKKYSFQFFKSPRLLLLLLLLSISCYFHHPILFSNESCRYYLILAVVDHHKLNVDDISTDVNDDLSFYNGHYYSAKAIGVPLLGAPLYWFIRNFTPLSETHPFSPLIIYIIRLFVTTFPFILLGVIMFSFSRRMGRSQADSIGMVLAYSFGSLAFNHAMIFSGHQTAASFCFFSFALIFWLKFRAKNNETSNSFYPLLAGLLAGIGALSDYTAMYIALILTLYIFFIPIPRHHKLLFILGGIPCAVLLVFYNLNCFGSPFSFSYSHLTNESFMLGVEKGLLGISFPRLDAISGILFSPSRGLFFIMPVFLYSIFGLFRMIKNKIFMPEAIVIIIIFLGYIFINGGFYGWHGGWTYGPRYLVPMLPFLAIPMVFAPLRSLWFALLLFISIFQIVLSASIYFHVPNEIVNPLIEIIIPFLSDGFTAINIGNLFGLKEPLSFLPLIILLILLTTLLFKKTGLPQKDHENIYHKLSSFILAIFIVVSLSLQYTQPERLVHCAKAHLLKVAFKAHALKKGIGPLLYEEKKCNSE